MKAVVYNQYGSPDNLQFIEIEKPAPKDNEVLVKVHAVSLNSADWRLLVADPFIVRPMTGGVLRPRFKILGADIAGTVETVGKNVTEFQPGDAVFGGLSDSCWGGLAEYVAAPENTLVKKPDACSFEDAATLPIAGTTALQGLRDAGRIKAGQKVLVNGASGGVGTFSVQIAKAFEAEVTAVCSTSKMDMARSIGADHVIDYTLENFTRGQERYDLILATNGYHPLSAYKRALRPNGISVSVGGSLKQIFEPMILGRLMASGSNKTLRTHAAKIVKEDLATLAEMLAERKIGPVIERCYPLDETPEAFRYLGEGHALGKIVISVVSW